MNGGGVEKKKMCCLFVCFFVSLNVLVLRVYCNDVVTERW